MKETPQYWELLSETDKEKYNELHQEFSSGVMKRARNGRAESFEEMLENIKKYCIRNDEDDWKRYLVCGVCWMDEAIAINTRQLRLLVCKCKSSINGSLQKMGFSTNMAHSESWKILFPKIPLLKDHFSELRKWTIRYKPKKDGETVHHVEEPVQNSSEEHEEASEPVAVQQQLSSPTVPLKFRVKMLRLQQAISI
ncbi:hypothetical protein TVAG_232670 [Trichomonas vaginalis G3]|uniref:Initiator binding domain-containing protein n=1 Tax=Trichomonas vaginalis (strain ATCC PRA-98 / G3) TaxID=412133 RepID=A2EU97_TRIV3|nr:transcription-initiator DNA-binding domain ibd family [Trichomonas vaginalis G3]EAY03784.1 hypothetical protein TVAG_232670 [Trichomonas vaginalis G3]KAI5494237.1 transcription-initiator DNA-binding domain ibd family [Trichomonas vaginalis G3]|eukprot:XP_001316007.1 hypothetical protein [Trichomonas vaginalis G3]